MHDIVACYIQHQLIKAVNIKLPRGYRPLFVMRCDLKKTHLNKLIIKKYCVSTVCTNNGILMLKIFKTLVY